jgi:hypothetical protein
MICVLVHRYAVGGRVERRRGQNWSRATVTLAGVLKVGNRLLIRGGAR